MPYSRLSDLPDNVTGPLPVEAQRIWMTTFNRNYRDCTKEGKITEDCENSARIIAWVAVKNSFKKGKDGKWIKKT